MRQPREKGEIVAVDPSLHLQCDKNFFKRFIAGTVYDPVEKEVIIGATVTLTEAGAKKAYTMKTDSYGDFEFEKLPSAKYVVTIEKGKKSKTIEVDTIEKDISLGDIPLA